MTDRIVQTTAHALILRSRPTASPTTDTGKRLIAGQIAASAGESWDMAWQFVVAPAGDGWASSNFLQEVPKTVPAVPPPRIKPWPLVPSGHTGIVNVFGEPCKPDCEKGRVTMPAPLPLSWNKAQSITRFSCHVLMVPVFTSVFTEIHRRNYWGLLEDYGGSYNCREQRGSEAKISTHSWGITIDLNANQNPLGAKPKMPPQIVGIFEDHGFYWGGHFHRLDGMHFQYAKNY